MGRGWKLTNLTTSLSQCYLRGPRHPIYLSHKMYKCIVTSTMSKHMYISTNFHCQNINYFPHYTALYVPIFKTALLRATQQLFSWLPHNCFFHKVITKWHVLHWATQCYKVFQQCTRLFPTPSSVM